MTIDKAQLKALAEALLKATDAWHENEQDNELGDMWHVADDNFTEACTPTAVLALLAEIERLEAAAFSISGAGGMELIAERDKLRAELAGLRTGYDAQNEVIAGLRKDAERYRWLRDKSESVHQFFLSTPIYFTGVKFSPENVDRTIDAAMVGEASHG